MNLKDLKIDLPKNWQEISRLGGENQICVKIYHISPLAKVDSKIIQGEILPSSDPSVNNSRIGVPSPNTGQPLRAFYDGMKASISSGFMPKEWTTQKLDNLWKQMTELNHPGEGDFSADISVAQYQNEKVAEQSFKNMGLMPTQGFNVPIPGGVKIEGLPENATMIDLLESDTYAKMVSQYVPKEQLEKLRSEIKKVQKQISKEVKPSLEKSGVQYKEIKYLGHEVICAEGKNPTPAPKPKLSSSSKNIPGGGGGFEDRLDPLPKFVQSYSEKTAIYQAMLVKKFVITGSLLWSAAALPSGNTPCYSLTQSKTKTTTMREGGKVFTDTAIVPTVSNYAKEGYLHKEEVEEILKKIIASL